MALKLGKCRLCMKLGDFYSIFSVDSSIQLAEMATACAQIKICEGDGLPDKVCGECVEKLSSAYIFKQQCERSDRELRRNYVPPPGFNSTPPPPNRQSSDSGYSNRTDVSFQPKSVPPPEEPPPTTSSSDARKKRKRDSDETTRASKSLLKESFSMNVASSAENDYYRPKTPDKRPRYEHDSDYEYSAPAHYSADSDSDSNSQIKCEKCDRTFKSKTSLAMHKRIHLKESKSPAATRPDVVVDIPQPSPDQLACATCGKTFKLQIMLKRHSETCQVKSPVLAEEPRKFEKLTCQLCNTQFKATANLAKHMRVVHAAVLNDAPSRTSDQTDRIPALVVPCLFCDVTLSDYSAYTSHFNTCSTGRKLTSYDCPLCTSRSAIKKTFFQHLNLKHFKEGKIMLNNSGMADSISEDTFECRICSKKLPTQDLLVTHLAAHMSNIDDGNSTQTGCHGSGVNSVEDSTSIQSEASAGTSTLKSCQFCDKVFTYRKSLSSHIAAKHSASQLPVEVKVEAPDSSCNVDNFLDSEDDEFEPGETDNTCDICEKTFSYRKSLLQHKRKKHPMTSGHKLSKVNINKCTVECLICDLTMQVKEIKAHNQTHIDANMKPRNKYTCSECSGSFKGMDSLRTHIKIVHRLKRDDPAKPKYEVTDVANFCEVVVTKSEPMDVTQGHNDFKLVPGEAIDGMKPIVDLSGFNCPICSKKMGTLISLKRHINWHNNVGNNIEKSHQCQICNAEFKFKCHFTIHMKDHYKDTNLDPKFLTCNICNRKSKHLRAAQAHSNWHKQTRFSNKDYQCSICKRVFEHRKVYLSHMAVHYKKGEGMDTTFDVNTSQAQTAASTADGEVHQCPHCQKILDSANSLKCHVSWHKSKASLFGSRYECDICKQQFTNKRRHELHIRTHYEDENGPYKCPICGKGYSHEKYFSCHVKGHNFDHQSHIKKRQKIREKRLKKVQCPICCRYYPDLLYLVRHLRRSHPESKMIKADPDAPPPTRFSCKLCAKTFLDERRLHFHQEMHLRKVQWFRCKFCGVNSKNMRIHNVHVKGHLTKKYRDEPLKCLRCEETFVLGYALHYHMRDVHGVRENWLDEGPPVRMIGPLQELQCTLCFKILASRGNFERHIDYHNTLRCNYCFEHFNAKVFLDGHLAFACEKRKLLGDTEVHLKRIKCGLCFKAFHLQVKLECHLWTQHGERDFQKTMHRKEEHVCDFCFRMFDDADALAGHKIYHRSVGFYGCIYCKRKFNTVTLFNKHKNHHLAQLCIENPVKCEHCDEKFDAFRDFIYHMRDEHGDDKDWIILPKESVEEECRICHKRFYNVQRHLRYHEENRCGKCRTYFYSRADLDNHVCEIESDEETSQGVEGPPPVYEECEFCFKPITKRVSRLKHDKLHNVSGSISCRFCPNKFKTLDTFNIHAFSHRNRKYKRNPLCCPHCSEKFVTYGPFVKHIRGVHGSHEKMHYRGIVLPEPCVVCGRSLPNLHNHYRAHLQNKCPSCNKYFTSSKLFMEHSCDKEDADPSKVFQCDENLYALINSYIPKEKYYELKYYGHQEDEKLDEQIETEQGPPDGSDIRAFLDGAPVISGVLSLHQDIVKSKALTPVTNGAVIDSDDDCVIVTDENEDSTPVFVELDD